MADEGKGESTERKNRIRIIDVTNRDGVQTARLCLSKLEKTMINVMLNDLGVFQSEFGFPVTRHERHYIEANLRLHEKGVIAPMRLEGWIRAIKADMETALKHTRVKHFNVSISTSEQMTQGKFGGRIVRRPDGSDKPSIIGMMVECVEYGKANGAETIGVNAEDASRTDMEFLIEFGLAAKKAGADRFRYCDTLGYDDPFTIYERVKTLAQELQMPIELHCHNDLGLAVANSIAGAKGALDAGQDAYINTTINGIGERAGNADLVSVILALIYASGFGYQHLLDERIDLSKSWRIAKYASLAFQVPIPINQVGVGANAFAHASGIHADGALKDRRNYELYDYELLGRGEPEFVETGREIIAGAYSGIKGFRNVYEKLEVEFRDDQHAAEILELVRYANVHTQRPLTDAELKFIAANPDEVRLLLTMTPPTREELAEG